MEFRAGSTRSDPERGQDQFRRPAVAGVDANGNQIDDGIFHTSGTRSTGWWASRSPPTTQWRSAPTRTTPRAGGCPGCHNSGSLDGTTQYVYSGQSDWQVIEERDGTGQVTRNTSGATSCTTVTMTVAGGATFYYHSNTLYSVAALDRRRGTGRRTLPVHAVRRPHHPWRLTALPKQPEAPSATRTLLAGPVRPETRLYYYGYRYYSPPLGRWLSRIPSGPLSPRRDALAYGFCREQPSHLLDMVGLAVENLTECLGLYDKGWRFGGRL